MLDANLAEWPMQRVDVFVDTQNPYFAARDGHGRHVDLARLLTFAARVRRVSSTTSCDSSVTPAQLPASNTRSKARTRTK